MVRLRLALARGVRLRCPACGRGRLTRAWGVFRDACAECRHVYLRDPGDWTGAAETSFILTVGVGVAGWLALGAAGIVGVAGLLGSLAVALVVFPFVFSRVRGLWIGLLALWADPDAAAPRGVDPHEGDPEWEHPVLLGAP